MCIQSVGLVARGLELNGIATVVLSWDEKRLMLCNPPRAAVHGEWGSPLGKPGDNAAQRLVLEQTLALLTKPAPHPFVMLDGREA